MERKVSNTIDSLKKNGFNVEYFNNSNEAKEKLLEEISPKKSIGIGGSMTIYNMNLHEDLTKRGNKVYWHWLVEPEKRTNVREQAAKADLYLSSSNSVTQDGKLVNIDGVGNRVASMFYGHDRVYIVIGKNKIAKDYEEAIKRIKTYACPKNAERLKLDTPCRYTGKCSDCDSPDRMCRVTVTIERNPMIGNINIYLVNEDLGY